MNIDIVKVLEEEKTILGHLIELYEYDFSEFENSDVNGLGLYGYSYFDYYWTEDRRYPYFIKVDGKLAGFVMVGNYCYVSKDNDTLFLSEFFVMKKYRKNGIGTFVASEILQRLHPGKWELTVHPGNEVALSFWNKVIGNCAKGKVAVYDNLDGVYDIALGRAYVFET